MPPTLAPPATGDPAFQLTTRPTRLALFTAGFSIIGMAIVVLILALLLHRIEEREQLADAQINFLGECLYVQMAEHRRSETNASRAIAAALGTTFDGHDESIPEEYSLDGCDRYKPDPELPPVSP